MSGLSYAPPPPPPRPWWKNWWAFLVGAAGIAGAVFAGLSYYSERHAAPSTINSIGSVGTNSGIVAPGATGPITQNNNFSSGPPATPPSAPIQIVVFGIDPLVQGMIPEAVMWLKNTTNSPKRIALKYRVTRADLDPGSWDNFQTRHSAEEALWARFESQLDPSMNLMVVPTSQAVSITMKGSEPVEDLKTEEKARVYFMSRALDESGKKIFDSCISVKPDGTRGFAYCVGHND